MKHLHIKNISINKLETPIMLVPLPEGQTIKGMSGILNGLEYIKKETINYILDRWDEPNKPYYLRRQKIIEQLDLSIGALNEREGELLYFLPAKTLFSANVVLEEHYHLMKDYDNRMRGSLLINPYGNYCSSTKKNLNRVFIPSTDKDMGTLIEITRDYVVIDNNQFGQIKVQKSKLKSKLNENNLFTKVNFIYGYTSNGLDVLEVSL